MAVAALDLTAFVASHDTHHDENEEEEEEVLADAHEEEVDEEDDEHVAAVVGTYTLSFLFIYHFFSFLLFLAAYSFDPFTIF